MISWTHISQRTVSDDETAPKAIVETPLTLNDDVVSTSNCLGYEATIDVAIGKTSDGKRRYVTLPFWQAMALEGYKLHVNAKVSPKKIDGMSPQEREEIVSEHKGELFDGKPIEMVNMVYTMLTAKQRKAFNSYLESLV